MENDDLKQNIEELFRLFKKLIEEHPIEDMPGINRLQYEQLRLFLQNYESMKDQLSVEMMGQMNEPMRQMLAMFVKQLREQLGEEAPAMQTPQQKTMQLDVERIDEMLRNPNLSEHEIDRLLDERARLNNSQSLQ
jgi:hypothetical protein